MGSEEATFLCRLVFSLTRQANILRWNVCDLETILVSADLGLSSGEHALIRSVQCMGCCSSQYPEIIHDYPKTETVFYLAQYQLHSPGGRRIK